MKILEIEDTKEFMQLLFLKDMFDKFGVSGFEVKTFVPISIRGNLSADWLTEEDRERYQNWRYTPWKLLRPVAFSLIRGNQTPQMLRVNFVHFMENGDQGGFRVQYEHQRLTCVSSYTELSYSMEREKERVWDEQCEDFLKKHSVVFRV